jgi:tetratricopeptide (TPR) repeat protein
LLLQLVFDRPREALGAAEALLASRPALVDAAVAHQVIGLVQREFGDLAVAVRHLRTAVRLARKAGSQAREADALATLGTALVHAGRADAGVAALDEALDKASGVSRARIRYRRGASLEVLGRHQDALADLRLAIPALRRAGDDIWTGRALTYRGLISLACGDIDHADRDFRAAERIHSRTGQRHEFAVARWNRGLAAFRAGDLPVALERLDDAVRQCRAAGVMPPDLVADRCSVLLVAGLPVESMVAAEAAADELRHAHGMATRRTELLLVAARAAYAAGDFAGAERRAGAVVEAFGRQRRTWWREHAVLLRLQSRFRAAGPTPRLLASATEVADRLHALTSPDAVQADLLAGRVALGVGRLDEARPPLTRASGSRHAGPVAARITGWLARALLSEAEGRDAAMLAACRRGLDLLDEYRVTLGATELRARVTSQGAELAELAQRSAARSGQARRLLVWSERWRATACAVPPVRPPDDRAALVDLVAMREISVSISRARERGEPVTSRERERARLETRIRDRALRVAGPESADRLPVEFSPDALLAALGTSTVLVEIVPVDGVLQVLVCAGGRVRRVEAGSAAQAASAVEQACWLLRRAAYAVARTPDPRLGQLAALGLRLQELLLGSAANHLGDGEVVLVPPGRLQGAPWSLLPVLAERAHAVVPSARAWLTARSMPDPGGGVVLVRGPDLSSGGGEMEQVAALHDDPVVLDGEQATAAAVTAALEDSALAHIAAHGDFRSASPLLSSLRMVDGPLTVYDLERLRRAPYRIVLSCCDSARLAPVGADELLGFATALLPLGTAGIVAGVVPVNDAATVPLMIDLHRSVALGCSLPQALLAARVAAQGDQMRDITSRSFVAVGAA